MSETAFPALLVLVFALILGSTTQAMDWMPSQDSEPLIMVQHPY